MATEGTQKPPVGQSKQHGGRARTRVRKPSKALSTVGRTETGKKSLLPGMQENQHGTRLDAALRARKAYEMRKVGATYALIAEQCGYSDASTCYKAVKRVIEQIERETGALLHALEVERLNALYMVFYNKGLQGSESAANVALRIMDKIEALEGIGQGEGNKTTNVGQVIVVGGSESDYVKALEQASTRQAALPSGQADIIDAVVLEDEFDAWEQSEAQALAE